MAETMAQATPGKHQYHAEATALSGSLTMPLKQTIDPQASAVLLPVGGYRSEKTGDFRVEGVVSFKSAHTQVSGMPGVKPGHGAATLTTAVIEGLNILEILTVDRIVAQISTEHPLEGTGHTPEIIFLGTRFENLRIAGQPLEVSLDIGTVGSRPPDDAHYLHHPAFQQRVAKQCQALRCDGLPDEVRERYTGDAKGDDDKKFIEFSLVNKITGEFPGRAFGHVLTIPNFGTVYLATVKITHEPGRKGTDGAKAPQTTVDLVMIEAKLGCIGDGNVNAGSGKTNGNGGT